MKKSTPDNKLLWQYAGLATQLLVGLGLMLWLGNWLDKYVGWKSPILVWILPLLLLLGILIKVFRDTSKR
ncbi:MAG: hypothetical protein B7Y15_07615 [Bacteroidetes bacterium 24-39-8]|nr:MAG: hypothetical protein B7Y69_09780 [Sphingobacteriia bacterium 35-40-8]OYZ50946.1 MAG: hypothetical protein B7Y15_07615 [Bacteroidetes bacterium 24-39-8]